MGKAKRRHVDPEWTEKHGCDGRPPITAAVAGLVDPDGRRNNVARRNTNHCTLCRLHHLGYLKDRVGDTSHDAKALSDMRHKAGEQLQNDKSLAGQDTIKGTLSSLEGGGSACGPAEIAQMKIDADRRKKAALGAVGTSGRALLEKIVLEDINAHEVAKELRMDKQGVVPMLRVALDALASHYGLKIDARGRIRGGAAESLDKTHPFQEQPQ